MSGHNKWSKIKHKKAAGDATKSKAFGKLARLIAVESKAAQGDIHAPNLRAAIEKAKSINMPGDNIDRAIKKGVGGDQVEMEHVLYEAYGPNGIAIIISGLTENKNRTSQEVKHILSKNGSSLAGQGAVLWTFTKHGSQWTPNTTIDIPGDDRKQIIRITDELKDNDDIQDVFTNMQP